MNSRAAARVAVADIDRFSEYNEIEGRAAGDRALQAVSQVARKAIRPGDILLLLMPQGRAADVAEWLGALPLAERAAELAPNSPDVLDTLGVILTELGQAERADLLSKEHFSVDGTMIEALASLKSYRPKDEDEPPGGEGGGQEDGKVFVHGWEDWEG